MRNIRSFDLNALTLQNTQLEIQKFRRNAEAACDLEEVHLLLQRFKNILIIQEELRSENVRFLLHPVRVIQEGKLVEWPCG